MGSVANAEVCEVCGAMFLNSIAWDLAKSKYCSSELLSDFFRPQAGHCKALRMHKKMFQMTTDKGHGRRLSGWVAEKLTGVLWIDKQEACIHSVTS